MPPADLPQFVLFGGSFNPVHTAHVEIARQLAALPGVAQVLVIPTGQSPFKPGAPHLPADLRYRMVSAAMAGVPGCTVLDMELRRPPPSYTVDTVAQLQAAYPQARLWVAMGMDVFDSYAAWHQAGALLGMAGLLVFGRQGVGEPALLPNKLPAPWEVRCQREADGHLVDDTGRRVAWAVPIHVPAVAASDLLRTRDLTHVPPAARPLLETYWREHKTAGGP
ncbi:MAG TPA: nicotinate-nicotinamide nucleotide adenylyltransferase [bacterium]